MVELTEGAIRTIMTGGEVVNPVVQILGSKVIPGNQERYRLLISDGVHLNSFAMLATQLTPMLNRGELVDYTIVKITNHVVSVVKNQDRDKRIMVILGVEVLKHGAEVGEKIGDPSNFTDAMQNEPQATTPALPPGTRTTVLFGSALSNRPPKSYKALRLAQRLMHYFVSEQDDEGLGIATALRNHLKRKIDERGTVQ